MINNIQELKKKVKQYESLKLELQEIHFFDFLSLSENLQKVVEFEPGKYMLEEVTFNNLVDGYLYGLKKANSSLTDRVAKAYGPFGLLFLPKSEEDYLLEKTNKLLNMFEQ